MILIIDDDAAIRASLTVLLKRAGYMTRTASNPDEAITEVRREIPQLVLLDMNFSRFTTGDEGHCCARSRSSRRRRPSF